MEKAAVLLLDPLASCHDWRHLALYLNAKICRDCKVKYKWCKSCPQALKIHELSQEGEGKGS